MGTYKFVPAPSGYPGRTYKFGNRILEHHLVWWQHTGTVVPNGYVVHHKNKIQSDNRFRNLELKERGKHTTDHCLKAPNQTKMCGWCGKKLVRTARDVRTKGSQGQIRFFCSSSHAAKYGWKLRHGGMA